MADEAVRDSYDWQQIFFSILDQVPFNAVHLGWRDNSPDATPGDDVFEVEETLFYALFDRIIRAYSNAEYLALLPNISQSVDDTRLEEIRDCVKSNYMEHALADNPAKAAKLLDTFESSIVNLVKQELERPSQTEYERK